MGDFGGLGLCLSLRFSKPSFLEGPLISGLPSLLATVSVLSFIYFWAVLVFELRVIDLLGNWSTV
jgi:hypothetical protein